MARSILALMLVALFLSSTMAQSPASSPRKALSPSSTSPAHSPAVETSPPSTSDSPASSPSISPSAISAPPSEAPAPASSGAVLNRVTLTGSAALVIFAAVAFLM